MKKIKNLRFNKNKQKRIKILIEDEQNKTLINKKNLNIIRKFEKSKKTNIFSLIKTIFIIIIIMIFLIVFLTLKKNIKKKGIEKVNSKENEKVNVKVKDDNTKNYYACFSGMGKKENKYVRELVEYYLKLGVEKFILGDNNLPNTEKLSDVLQDYINDGTVDIIDLIDSSFGQSALNNVTYEKYNKRCKWMLFLDFDEFLEVHFEDKKSLPLKEFLENKIFEKCEAILFNILVYTDNNLVHYDNRPLNERFTEPNYNLEDANYLVKAIVRGNLNKTIYVDGKPNNSPVYGVEICDSMGRKIKHYDSYNLKPPVYDYGYLKHFTTKTAEEYIDKVLKGTPGKHPHNVYERIKLFFRFNKYSEEKMKIFENYFNQTFHGIHHNN